MPLILLLFVGGIIFYLVATRNVIIASEERVFSSLAQVENVLQRRYDLIPNLVNTVKGYTEHDRALFREMMTLHSQWFESDQVDRKSTLSHKMETQIEKIMTRVESYPNIRSDQNFLALQYQLEGSENRIAVERRRYNESLRDYHTAIRTFPGNLFGFQSHSAYFQMEDAAANVPIVEF